ncbi:NB-ARC domain-containing protein [Beggiatoa leptomitoformis]|nr:NB-ARC domain-containing protein [Beggiatoa leptomitoformis]
MTNEFTVEQEITLLKQDSTLLNEALDELKQKLAQEKNVAQQQVLQEKIKDMQIELSEAQKKLASLKQAINVETEGEQKLGAPAKLYAVPTLPSYILSSPIFNELKAKLVVKPTLAEGADGQKNPILLLAPSGSGKSLQAIALANDISVRRAFSEGIFWLNMGSQPDIVGQQIALIRAFNIPAVGTPEFISAEEGLTLLRGIGKGRSCLFILDDVYDVRDVMAFAGLGKGCQLLITSCYPEIADDLKHFMSSLQTYALDALTQEQAVDLFSNCSGKALSEPLPADLLSLFNACEYSPTTLRLVAQLTQTMSSPDWTALLSKIQNKVLDFPEAHASSLSQALHLNIEALGDNGEYYLTLGMFADYTNIPQAAIVLLWRYLYHLPDETAYSFIQQLAAQGLLYFNNDSTRGNIHLHPYQHDYLCEFADLDKLHTHLLAAYRRYCQPHGWAKGPNDGYFFEYLCLHLLAAERNRELKTLLMDFDWLNNKLQATSLHNVIQDFDLLEDDVDIATVKQALQRSAPILVKDKSKLADKLLEQLWGKPSSDIQSLLNQAKEMSPDWLPPPNR